MAAAEVSARAAALLIRDTDLIARSVTDDLFRERPYLIEKHVDRGREKTLQDMRYNIEHLVPAVELGDPGMFSRYIEWLDSMLRSRGVDTKEVVRCLELLRDECQTLHGDEFTAIAPVIDAGLAVVRAL